MIMRLQALALIATVTLAPMDSVAQEVVTLRIHQFLPAAAPIPSKFIIPWAKKVEGQSKDRIKFEIYHSMQLGGAPSQLFDQVKDGIADIVWAVPGYTAGRFPRTEVLDLPFIAANGERTSRAAWAFYEKNLKDEYKDAHIIAFHTHGSGIIHAKGSGVRKLEDLRGMKIRAPSRLVNKLVGLLGGTPVGLPAPAIPDALQKGVLDAAVIPWEVTTALRITELVSTHTTFSGNRSLYVNAFIFAMNKAKYDSLPSDLKRVIDDNSGPEVSAWAGKVMDDSDILAREAAKNQGNSIVILDSAETMRWKKAAAPLIDDWINDMKEKGFDGKGLIDDLRSFVEQQAGPPS